MEKFADSCFRTVLVRTKKWKWKNVHEVSTPGGNPQLLQIVSYLEHPHVSAEATLGYAVGWVVGSWVTQQQCDLRRGWRLASATQSASRAYVTGSQSMSQAPRLKGASLAGSASSMWPHIVTGKIRCCPFNSSGGRQLEAYAWLSWTRPHVPLPFADFSLHPFSIINCSHECNSLSGSVESFQQITKPDWWS